MSKMTTDDLLSFLEAEQDAAFQYNDGELAKVRTQALRDYLRMPYGTELDGRSSVVASDVFDTINGILPDLVETFVSTDKAVVFDPVGEEDVEGAEQATNACNHVFYKQNNGFLVLVTSVLDGLLMRTGTVKWWWEVKRTPNFETFAGDELQIAVHLLTHPDAEVVEQEELEPDALPPEVNALLLSGMPLPPEVQSMVQAREVRRYRVKLKTVKKRGIVRVAAVPGWEIEVAARHNSILLEECPYVSHKRLVTLSEINEMGLKADLDDVKAARAEASTQDQLLQEQLRGLYAEDPSENEETLRGWLREEYVLLDYDGDGIAERRKITRLGKKILDNVEFSHVPLASWTPYLLPHQYAGLSVQDLTTDFQRIGTEVWRAQLDNLALANNQETVVLTDTNGAPRANIDDLLNRRPGGILRETQAGAIRPYVERWQGIEAMPMIQQLQQAKEKRTGYSPVIPGLDAEGLQKTAMEVSKTSNERQKRSRLMARLMAETMVSNMMRGIFKTLTDYCIEKLSFRLNGKFVSYDPQEWRDGYDMTVNVGIGSGDELQQMQFLMGLSQTQGAIAQSPFGSLLLDAEKVYNLQARMIELAGFKNPQEFINEPPKDPQTGKVAQPQSGPPPQILLEQMKGQIQMGLQQAKNEVALQQKRAELELQAANDMRDFQREQEKSAMDMRIREMEALMEQQLQGQRLAFDRQKAELDASVKLLVANMGAQQKAESAALAAAEREASQEIQP